LACYGALGTGTPWQPLPAAVQQLEQLLGRAAALAELSQHEQNRLAVLQLAAAVPAAVQVSFTQLAAAVAAAQAELAAAVQALLRAEPVLAKQAARLATVPGVGPQTVLPLLVLLERFRVHTDGQGSSAALAAYVGLDP
jgi:hypothetical protein